MTTTADLRAILDAADSVPGLQSRYGTAIDDLIAAQRDLATATADATTARADRDTAQAEALRLGSDLTAARAAVEVLHAEVAAREATIAELRAHLAAAQQTDPSTVEPVRATIFGSCPAAGGTSLKAAQSVLDKWGRRRAIRQFNPASFAAPQHPADAAIVHTSWKPSIADLIAGKLDAIITAIIQAMIAGDASEPYHEADKKVRDGVYSLADVIAAKNRYYDLVKATRDDVLVVTTYTGWLLDPASGLDPYQWKGVKADLLGVDLDGIAPKGGVYPDFSAEIALAARLAKEWGYKGWCVPELGAPRDTVDDADGAKRAAWLTKTAALCKEAGARYVCLFEYPTSPNNELTTPAEVAAWQAVIG